MTRLDYFLRTLFNLPVYFYCRYYDTAPRGCLCYYKERGKKNRHVYAHPRCFHCTPTPRVVCGKCGGVYDGVVKPSRLEWSFGVWRGWRHVACPERSE